MKQNDHLDDDAMTPEPDTELVPGEDADAVAQSVIDRLQSFSDSLTSRRAEWISARAARGLDKRWQEDLDQYNGKDGSTVSGDSMMETAARGYPALAGNATTKLTRSTVYVPVTRQKTNAAHARFCDVALPTDEANFGVAPTAIPNMPKVPVTPVAAAAQEATSPAPGAPSGAAPAAGATPPAGGTGGSPPAGMSTAVQQAVNGGAATTPAAPSPAPAGPSLPAGSPAGLSAEEQELLQQAAAAKTASEAMQREIEDCFDECDFNAEARRAAFDMTLLGTAVMKGPVVFKRTRRKWSMATDMQGKPIWSLVVSEELRPASFRVNPQCFYPDPACGENVQNGRGAFEVEKKTAKQVRLLAKQPEYIKSQLRLVLEEGPQQGRALNASTDMEDRDVPAAQAYEHWIYWGEVDREDLIAAGVTVSDDDLEVVSACIEMINSTIVRAYLNHAPDGALPYDMSPWERHPGSVWGYGVPYLMRAQQKVINAAWRMLLDNAGVSAGPQIVVKQGAITPADGQWTVTSRKIWYADDDVEDVTKAFATFEFNMHQQELNGILEQSEKLADEVTAVPMLTAAQQGASPDTVGGMQMLMNAANAMLRRLIKQYDDCLIKPHVRRYYDFLMEYSDRDDIKGDFQVVALGSSSLVVRDAQNQAIVQLLALASNPTYTTLINVKKLFAKALKAQHIDPDDVMNTDSEIQQAQQAMQAAQKPDPRVQASQLRAEADQKRTDAQVKMNSDTLQAKENIAQAQQRLEYETLMVQRDIEMMRMSEKQGISLQQIKAQLAAVAMQERSKQDIQAMNIHVKGAQEAPAM